MPIDWSNPAIQGVVIGGAIGLAGVVIAALAGYFGGKAGARIGADAAREAARLAQQEAQADRQAARDAREADRQDARLDRFADRKLSLAVDLLLAADLRNMEARSRQEAMEVNRELGLDELKERLVTIGDTAPIEQSALAFEVVAPAIAPAAYALHDATRHLCALAETWPHSPVGEWQASDWDFAQAKWEEARAAFLEAVRRDLGVSLV